MHPGFVSEQSECRSFFGDGGQTEFVCGTELQPEFSKTICQHRHKGGILSAAAGDDELAILRWLGENETAHRVRDRLGSECSCSRHDVACVGAAATKKKFAGKFAAELLAAGCPGWLAMKERFSEDVLDNFL